MQGNIKCSFGPFIKVQYNGYIEVSMQGYSKGSLGPFITFHYNG
jgi:hypothetical protein